MKKTKEFDIFNHNIILRPICEKLTHHKHRKLIGWCEEFSKNGYKNAKNYDFWYKCNICGYTFFNHKVSKEDLEKIKQHDKEELEKK